MNKSRGKNRKIILLTDLTGIWLDVNKSNYERFINEILTNFGIKKRADWNKYSKLARIGKITYAKALKLWLKDCGLEDKFLERKFIKEEKRKIKKFLVFRNRGILRKVAKEFKIIALTDSSRSSKEIKEILKIGKMDKYFHRIISSHDLKKEKPLSFFPIIKRYNRNFLIFLGHDDDEIIGAKKLGIVTIGLNNQNADYKIKNLSELYRIIKNIKKLIKKDQTYKFS
jgi:FMN phosphatase YigB (HAD superfamily)